MKKTKLLIPALWIASVATIATPMLTSCNPYVEYHLSFSKYVDGARKEYEWRYKDLEATRYQSQADMAKAYFAAVKADPYIFADDVMYTISANSSEYYKSQTMTLSDTKVMGDIMLFSQYITLLSFQFSLDQTGSSPTVHEVLNINADRVPYQMFDKVDAETFNATTVLPYLYWIDTQPYLVYRIFAMTDFNIQISYKKYSVATDNSETLQSDICLEIKCLDDLMLALANPKMASLFNYLKMPILSHYYKLITYHE